MNYVSCTFANVANIAGKDNESSARIIIACVSGSGSSIKFLQGGPVRNEVNQLISLQGRTEHMPLFVNKPKHFRRFRVSACETFRDGLLLSEPVCFAIRRKSFPARLPARFSCLETPAKLLLLFPGKTLWRMTFRLEFLSLSFPGRYWQVIFLFGTSAKRHPFRAFFPSHLLYIH